MAQTQPFGFACKGGLDVNRSDFALQQEAGTAVKLENFEVDSDGGYRRINGFAPLAVSGDSAGRIKTTQAIDGGSGAGAAPDNTIYTDKILGIEGYMGGGVVCSGTNIFFTQNGADAIRINRSSVASDGDSFSAFQDRDIAARTNQGQVDFTTYEGAVKNNQLIICDGVNNPLLFHTESTAINTALGSITKYHSKTIAPSTNPTLFNPKFAVSHKRALVFGGFSSQVAEPTGDDAARAKSLTANTIRVSAITDITDIEGGSTFILEDKVVGLRSFRDDLIIFCSNSIHRLVNMTDATNAAIVPITKNIGCISQHSIQEIGGDLVFLSPDGLRTLAGTEKIGDTELGSISRPIYQLLVSQLINKANTMIVSSTVLRTKNQYRLFFTLSSGEEPNVSRGIIGTITKEGWAWSTTVGIQATAIATLIGGTGLEQAYHGDKNGSIYEHDVGTKFVYAGVNGDIQATYTTPTLDFGDIGTQKTLSYLNLQVETEGPVQPKVRVFVGEENGQAVQPSEDTLPTIFPPTEFGVATFSGNSGAHGFGAFESTISRLPLRGSGNNFKFRVQTKDQNPCYSIQGMYVNYYPSGRR